MRYSPSPSALTNAQGEALLKRFMHRLNHANLATTKCYLGITDDELQAIAEGLNL